MKKFWVKLGISIILIVGGFILSFLCLDETNATSVLTYHDQGVYSVFTAGPLILGQTIRGQFRAQNNNLGIVKLRIRTFNRINTTHIQFVIREKGTITPLATNTYATDRFTDGLLYPFGFPVIADSNGKTYEFTVESSDGTPDNAIGIVTGYHDVASQYVFQKSGLRGTLLRAFLTNKARSILSDPYWLLYITMFLVPALYLLLKRFREILVFFMLIVYTYVPISMHSNTILVVAASVLGLALLTRASASRIYVAALLWLVQIPVMIALGNVLSAERAATLVFFLMLVGGIISLTQLNKK